MKRFLSLFLVVNVLVCYGGFFRSAIASEGSTQVKSSSGCHSISHETNKTGNENAPKIINNSDNNNISCCFESLTNTHPDLNAKIEIISIDKTQLAVLNEGKDNLNKILDNSIREHDPPDLQISNSTFLL